MSEKLEIPESWAEVTIDVLLKPLLDGRVLHHGWSPQCETEPSTSDDEWGVLKTTAVQDGLYLEEHNKRLPASLTPRKHLEVQTGDILITCAGPRNRCGVPCHVRHTRPKLILSGKMYRFRVHETVMDAGFLEGYLRAKDTQTAIDGMKTGISDSGLNLTHGRFFRLKVPVAPLQEQKRIVAKIEELFSDLDAGVAALLRAKGNLKRYRAAVLKAAVEGRLTAAWRAEQAVRAKRDKTTAAEPAPELLARILRERRQKWEADQLAKFAAAGKEPPKNWQAKYVEPTPPDTTGLPELPDGWCWASAEQLSDETRAITYGVVKLGDPVVDGVPTLRSSNVRNLRLDLDEVKQISRSIAAQYKRTFLEGGELLFTVRGTLGGIVVAPDGCRGWNVSREVAVLAPVDRRISDVTAIFIASGPIQNWLSRNTRGIAYTGVNIETLKELPLPLSPLLESNEIVSVVEERLSQIDAAETAIEHGLQRAARLRQSILKQAFEGKLVPQDPTDEPAAALLERIRAGRGVPEGNGQSGSPKRSGRRSPKSKPATGRADA